MMQVAICGLGRMGAGMARRLARGGHDVVAWNRTEQVAIDVAAEPENGGRITVAEPVERLRELLTAPRHVLISVPSGDATRRPIEQLAAILEPGDVIIDAGNSNFHDSQRRAAQLEERASTGSTRRSAAASGASGRLLPDDRRQAGGVRRRRAGVQDAGARGRLPVLRAGRRRATTSRWSTTASSTA